MPNTPTAGIAATLSAGLANDVAISPDGSLIYAAGSDGNLRVYDALTGQLENSWHVGTDLGGIDISPDGTFLMATELTPVATRYTDNWTTNQTDIVTYKVDLATGQVTTYPVTVTGDEYTFNDVAIGSDGTVVLSQNGLPGWSVWLPAWTLNLSTGVYTSTPGEDYTQSDFLSRSSDGTHVLFGESNISDARIAMWQDGSGFVAIHDWYADGVEGYNSGIQAISGQAGLVAQGLGSNIYIYDLSLQYQQNLTTAHLPQLTGDYVAGLAFDSTGQNLYVLDSTADTITQVSTSDWSVVQTISVAATFQSIGSQFADSFLVSPDSHYFTILTDHSVLEIGNPSFQNVINGTSGDDQLTGTIFTDVINGLDGNDTLNGLAGADTLNGGAGDDTYIVGDSAATIVEAPGGGTDQVNASVDFVLPDNVENMTMTGSTSLRGTGNALDNHITANDAGDLLVGGAGNDTLTGGAGNDIFVGGAGNDTIDGGNGFDTVDYSQESGGAGVYVNIGPFAITYGNGLSLAAGHATDTYGDTDTLTSIEHVITGAGDDLVIGSPAAETIETGAGNDFIYDGGGADTLIGGSGDDTYALVANSTSTIVELPGGGIDEVQTPSASFSLAGIANVENLTGLSASGQTLTGNNLDNRITGSTGNDIINGGLGADTLTGGLGQDTLTGGGGNDTFKDSAAGLNGDTITDYSAGDKIVITDATPGSFDFTISGHTLSYTGGSLTLSNMAHGRVVVGAAEGGGVQLLLNSTGHNDFNDDGMSDILWRNDSGYITEWVAKSDGSGGFTSNQVNAGSGAADPSWHVVGTGDFNGDGMHDILWRNDSGYITEWLGTANGGFTSNEAHAGNGSADPGWQVAGTGDFNGDGISDILWRNTGGYVTEWLGTSDGGFTSNQANAGTGAADNSWQVAGTGDFNGDGISDILWRNTSGYVTEWLGTATGGFTDNSANAASGAADTGWQVAGTGDFNGDGISDILWRNVSSGYTTEWLGTSTGGFTDNAANAATGAADTSWHVVSLGDFNGDGMSDILWRNSSGYTTEWLGTSSGGFVSNEANAGTSAADSTWHVQDPFLAA